MKHIHIKYQKSSNNAHSDKYWAQIVTIEKTSPYKGSWYILSWCILEQELDKKINPPPAKDEDNLSLPH